MTKIKRVLNGKYLASLYGDFGPKLALVRCRGNTIEVDLNDIMPRNKIFGALGCDGALHLNLATKKSPRTIFDWIPRISFVGGNKKRYFTDKYRDLVEYGYSIRS